MKMTTDMTAQDMALFFDVECRAKMLGLDIDLNTYDNKTVFTYGNNSNSNFTGMIVKGRAIRAELNELSLIEIKAFLNGFEFALGVTNDKH